MFKGQTILFPSHPVITSSAAVVGPVEGKGPLAEDFDKIYDDLLLHQDSWEKAERKLMLEAAKIAIKKSGMKSEDIQFYIGGDLMDQIVSSSFSARQLGIPFLGVFGACSTAMESLALAAMMVDSSKATAVLAGTCSHNASAEKQFRYPTEYGSQKPPSAQYTVTGAGASIVQAKGRGPLITSATIGKVIDLGVKDPFQMGAAMAPSAVDTIEAHCRDLNIAPGEYDLIVTGDLAKIGHSLALDLFAEKNFPIDQTTYKDCGLMIYDIEKQEVQSGGSGCGCSASVTYGHILKQLQAGEYEKILVVATGSLLSPLTYQQGESIPCVAHAVALQRGRK
ncbi:stage V sporulation protein AD [Longirhabdus pacifica]|uniref:stage V sporulation protein AD n=1 Tax=Longirhabdus pacifica TaxID=2305227 RepID=UPI001008D224|nr:stage V sporulation protein AD [Longirhabdus pacifica]